MKAFHFSLQSVRVIRERKEQLAQVAYADALRAHEAAQESAQRASDALALGWEALCRQLAAGATATVLRRDRSWCSTLETRHQERMGELQLAKSALDTAARALMHAARDRQAIDRLHDKCRTAYDREGQREEQKRLDELGLRRNAGGWLRGLSAAHGN